MRALTLAVISLLTVAAGGVLGQDAATADEAKPVAGDALRPVPGTDIAEPSAERETGDVPPSPSPAKKFPYEAAISGTNVNVRSGNGTNYYPVTRLHSGHRVTVLGAEYGWVKIAPPAGCYSLVDMKFVDPGENDTGSTHFISTRL